MSLWVCRDIPCVCPLFSDFVSFYRDITLGHLFWFDEFDVVGRTLQARTPALPFMMQARASALPLHLAKIVKKIRIWVNNAEYNFRSPMIYAHASPINRVGSYLPMTADIHYNNYFILWVLFADKLLSVLDVDAPFGGRYQAATSEVI